MVLNGSFLISFSSNVYIAFDLPRFKLQFVKTSAVHQQYAFCKLPLPPGSREQNTLQRTVPLLCCPHQCSVSCTPWLTPRGLLPPQDSPNTSPRRGLYLDIMMSVLNLFARALYQLLVSDQKPFIRAELKSVSFSGLRPRTTKVSHNFLA